MEPKYDKYPSEPHRDYRLMTWETFLTVREWAQEVANAEGYPVYLVGSALRKLYPRDIDVSMIIPLADFEARYGPIPDNEHDVFKYLGGRAISRTKAAYQITLNERLRWVTRVDFKVTPDTWHTNEDKMLLAEPGGKACVRWWKMAVMAKEDEAHDGEAKQTGAAEDGSSGTGVSNEREGEGDAVREN